MRYGYMVAVVAAEAQEGSQFEEVLGAQAGHSGNRNDYGFFQVRLKKQQTTAKAETTIAETTTIEDKLSEKIILFQYKIYEKLWSFDPLKSRKK